MVAEALAYDLYRRAGNAAPLTEFMRLTVDGQPRGTHLLIERPNKGFLRRNRIDCHLTDAISLPAEYQQRAPRICSTGAAL